MVIACPSCHTRFRLSEDRLTGAWTKVRCSRCQHLFQISAEGEVGESFPPVWTLPADDEAVGAGHGASASSLGDRAELRPDAPQTPAAGSPPAEAAPLSAAAAAGPEEVPPRRGGFFLLIAAAAILGLALGGGLGWYLKHQKRDQAAAPDAPLTTVHPPATEPPPRDLKELAVVGGETRFQGLVSPRGGRLLVIAGEVHNRGEKPRGPVRLKATLTDPQNQPLKERLFFAGSSFTDEELQRLAPEELERWLDTPGGRSRIKVVRPGEKQAFAVIFFEMPEKLALSRYGYTVSVVEGPVASAAPPP
ncbi:MAG: DUF3426 domain-containing protein [Deltaproteobacteria bacterium]|nr:DUF3426 domain-containing protein [Deltaproteobacteria bacterium]